MRFATFPRRPSLLQTRILWRSLVGAGWDQRNLLIQ